MIFARPTPEQERWIAVAAQLGIDRDRPAFAARIGGWKGVGPFARCALAALGAAAAGLTLAIVMLMHVPGPYFVAGLVTIGVAEALVGGRRFFGAGVEEALGVAGLLMVAFELVAGSGSAFEIRLSLAVAAALAVAGWRFLNPLFTTLAVAVLSFTASVVASNANPGTAAGVVTAGLGCFVAAATALALGARTLRRPAHDRMLDWLVVAMPLAGYLWLAGRPFAAAPGGSPRVATLAGALAILLPLLFAVAGLGVGIRRRRHAPILAAMGCAGCLAYELRHLTGLSLEVRLLIWGSLGLVLALLLERYLRVPRDGITSQRIGPERGASGLLQLVGVGALTPPAAQPQEPAFKGGGGTFDGGGASGRY